MKLLKSNDFVLYDRRVEFTSGSLQREALKRVQKSLVRNNLRGYQSIRVKPLMQLCNTCVLKNVRISVSLHLGLMKNPH